MRTEIDAASGYVRHSVTTHSGVYTGWVTKPQLTFFALTAPTAQHGHPALIGLIFRALEPQAVRGTSLILSCPDHTDSIGVAATSQVVPTGNTQSHFLSYALPVDRAAGFARCTQGTLAIAQVTVRFSTEQLGGLRALLVAVRAGSAGAE